jgi:hypothetical protein
VDFAACAKEFQDVEQQHAELLAREALGSDDVRMRAGDEKSELIQNPHVVCVTSPQFKELGYANQIELVQSAFPDAIRHRVVLNSADLKRILLDEQVDIVHIAAFVCPRGGDLYFTAVDLPLGHATAGEVDVMKPDALISLLREANTRLVVLGASASLVLGAQLLTVTNVIAVRDMVSARAMASWVDTFYKTLLKQPLADSFELATQVSQAPMRLYAQQREFPSFKLQMTEPSALTARH